MESWNWQQKLWAECIWGAENSNPEWDREEGQGAGNQVSSIEPDSWTVTKTSIRRGTIFARWIAILAVSA
jgi:hypothetical protein